MKYSVAGAESARDSSRRSRAPPPAPTQAIDFDCPEEFGYYAHPTDCTQYYVCVFGGALLESCTGGLMYRYVFVYQSLWCINGILSLVHVTPKDNN